jgi:hypothetical protein
MKNFIGTGLKRFSLLHEKDLLKPPISDPEDDVENPEPNPKPNKI